MSVHYSRSSGAFAKLFGIGQVQTLCGTEVPASNYEPDKACNCSKCELIANGSSPDSNRPPLF